MCLTQFRLQLTDREPERLEQVNAYHSSLPRFLRSGLVRRGSFSALSVSLLLLLAAIFSAEASRAAESCPNEVFRTGAAAKLPDCRAYELVTPADTSGLEPRFTNGLSILSHAFNTQLITPEGDDVLFQTSEGALSGTDGTGTVDRYRATRTPNGWGTELIGAKGDEAAGAQPGGASSDQEFFFARTFNLIGMWEPWFHYPEATMLRTPSGFEPAARGSLGDDPDALGKFIAPGGSHIVFTSRQHLEPGAPAAGKQAVYDREYGGATQVVSLLPGDVTPTQDARYVAASKDGSEIVFEVGGSTSNQGQLYVRRNGTTIPVPVPSGYTFAGLFAGQVFYADRFTNISSEFIQNPADLYSYDLDTATTTAITHSIHDASFVNVSEDGSRVFFVSTAALTGAEENQLGQTATPEAKGSGTFGYATGHGTGTTATGTGQLSKGSTVVSNVNTKKGTFQVGMEIHSQGFFIREETTITAVGPGTLTLSKPATGTINAELEAGSRELTEVSTSEGAFEVGMEVTSNGFRSGTTITAVGPGTLALSRGVSQSGTMQLSAGSKIITGLNTSEGQFTAGMAINGTGIRTGTTITAVGAGTLTLSRAVTVAGVQALVAGYPNLYVWSRQGDSTKFIATVTPEDASSFGANEEADLTTWYRAIGGAISDSTGLASDHTRSTRDGSVLAFETTARLTAFDNTEASAEECGSSDSERNPVAGQACDEVYRYETETGELECVSCGPGAGPATGNARLQSVESVIGPVTPLPAYTAVQSLSEDGNTLFFESTESLLPRDANHTKDVYEWEKGKGLSLISTGQSQGESALWAVTPDGSDVAFATREKLLPQDVNGSAIRVYDARVDGGFPPPESTVTEPCTGDPCQGSPSAAPPAPETASGSLQANGGNVPGKLSCAKGRRVVVRRGKEQCVKRHPHHHKKRNHTSKRGGHR
jgi:hypothetical protein